MADQKEYYEAQLQKKLLYIPNLSNFADMLNRQILRLPSEILNPETSLVNGTKYSDIVESFCNGVEVLEANIGPLKKKLGDKCPKYEPLKDGTDFRKALKKMEWIYDIFDIADVLNDNVVSYDLPDASEDYDDLALEDDNNEPDPKTMPTPKHQANDEALGAVEEQNEPPVAKEDMATGLSE